MFNRILKYFSKGDVSVTVEPGAVSDQDDTYKNGIGNIKGFYDFKEPKFPVEYLDVLEMLSIYNPDIKQALSIAVNLGNSGHDIFIESKNAESVKDRLDEVAANVYKVGGGMDGLVNHFIRQVTLMGALSAEWVISEKISDGVCDVVIPPVRTIRFKKDDGIFKPYQYVNKSLSNRYIELNPFTYSYSPVETLDGSPYGIPGYLSTLKNIEIQINSIKGFAKIVKKMGLLGFVDVSLKIPPKKPGESDGAYNARLQSRLKDYAKAYSANLSEGVGVHYEDQSIKHNSLGASAATSAKTLFQVNEEQIMSGLDTPPSMMGRSYSSTETYASVDFKRMITRLENAQRIIKRFIEKGYSLDLLLRGINAEVSVRFNEISGIDEIEKIEAESKRIENVIKKRDAGFISDDEGARELGYEKATGKRDAKQFSFNRQTSKYDFVRPSLEINKLSIEKRSQNYIEALNSFLKDTEQKALKSIKAVLNKKYKDEKDFAKTIYNRFRKVLVSELDEKRINKKSDQYVEQTWKYYRFEDNTFLPGKVNQALSSSVQFTLTDMNALRYLQAVDKFYFGTGNYLANDKAAGNALVSWLEREYISKGYSLKDDKTREEFFDTFSDHVAEVSTHKINQLVNTTMGRIRNFGQTLKLHEAGIKKYRIVGPRHGNICAYCLQMVGRVFEVKRAAQRLAGIIDKGFESVDDLPPFITNKYTVEEVSKMTDKQLQDKGFESPPFHPECRHRKAAEV